jgi:Tfp pilus assembly protein PilF
MNGTLRACIAAACWLLAGCAVNQNLSLLAPGPGSWIVYPSPPRVTPLAGTPMTAVFRREFVLPTIPAEATVSWRCFKSGQLSVNGSAVNVEQPANWHKVTRMDVAAKLRPGTNEIEARVTCANGLPAVSLEIEAGDLQIDSDETWKSSLAGAIWEPAQLASRPTDPAPGNWIYGAEDISGAWRTCWPIVAGFALLAALAAVALTRRIQPPTNLLDAGLILTAAAWLALFLHNFRLVPAWAGFDASAHLAYIQFIQEHNALPSAGQGWEMFQAPLYYVLSTGLLKLFHLHALQPEAAQVLCVLNLVLGAAGVGLIWSAMRLLFPERRGCQLAALLFAAILPAQIYLLHYPTNEILGAVTTTASLCLCLRILRQDNPRPRLYAALGIALATALLSKASAIVVLPAIFLALGVQARRRRQPFLTLVRNPFLSFGLCMLLGGWHYFRLWKDYGSPLVGNWDPAVGGAWWQQPGYRAPSYYLTFGKSLAHPYFSGFHSFWDGLYSTWWGDGCFGGATRIYGRTPWNYDLMTVGFVLALIPSALVLTGFSLAIRETARRRRLDWLLLTTVALLFGFAIFVMSLKLPFYSESRAMYALPTLLPFCAFGALGLEFWTARLHKARPILYGFLGTWILTVYTSFWIRPDTVQTRLSRAVGLLSAAPQQSAPAFEKVLELDPTNPIAIESLADLDKDAGRLTNALARLEPAAQTMTNAMIWTSLALDLAQQGNSAKALEWSRRACEIAPDYPSAPALLCSLALRAGQNDEAIRAGRLALRLTPQDYDIHFNVGLALVRLKQFAEAVPYFSAALDDSPTGPDSHFWLGIALWNLPGNQADALEQITAAVRLSPQNLRWKSTLVEMQKETTAH